MKKLKKVKLWDFFKFERFKNGDIFPHIRYLTTIEFGLILFAIPTARTSKLAERFSKLSNGLKSGRRWDNKGDSIISLNRPFKIHLKSFVAISTGIEIVDWQIVTQSEHL